MISNPESSPDKVALETNNDLGIHTQYKNEK